MIKHFKLFRQKYLRVHHGYTVSGALYWLWLKLRRKDIRIEGGCNCCGRCCRSISLEGSRGWFRSIDEFTVLKEKNPDYYRFVQTGRDEAGYLLFSCSWLGTDNRCQNYQERMSLCDRFPEKSLFFCGGQLPEGCGYRLTEIVSFHHCLRREMKKHL